jgi:hypothetical protein
MTMNKLILVLVIFSFLPGCEKNQDNLNSYPPTKSEDFDNLVLGDTSSISWHSCLKGPENKMYICLESVLNDSRCPRGAFCVWEGNASVRFRLGKENNKPVFFDLNTHGGFTSDTIIFGYKFSLVGLVPYPALNHTTDQKEYKALLVIEKE